MQKGAGEGSGFGYEDNAEHPTKVVSAQWAYHVEYGAWNKLHFVDHIKPEHALSIMLIHYSVA